MGSIVGHGMLIDVDRKNLFYFTNEIISGSIRFNITEDIFEFREIYITLKGKGTGEEVDINSRNIRKVYDDEDILGTFHSSKLSLIGSKTNRKLITLKRGTHSYPFQISIPCDLPPSISATNKRPGIVYCLKGVVRRRQ